jgi:hypothetical protein
MPTTFRLTRHGQHFHIDQQMVMSGVLVGNACRRYTHALESETDGEALGDGGTVLRRDDVDLCPGRGLGDRQRRGIGGQG